MEPLSFITTVALIHLLAAMSPGPDLVMAIRNSLTYSRRTGLFTAVGFGLGIAVHVVYCIAGVAVLIAQSILLFNLVKLLGAAYLIYIGIQTLRSRGQPTVVEATPKESDLTAFQAVQSGFLTNVLNPKVTLFFLSLFTLVVTPEVPTSAVIVAGAVMVVNTMLWFSLVAICFTNPFARRQFDRYQEVFQLAFGTLLVGFGLRVAFHRL